MDTSLETTRAQIMQAGCREFLDKGFKDASMRAIASQAGVTTGAIYGYFPDKEALFTALVQPAANELKRQFITAQESFSQLPHHQQIESMHSYSSQELYGMLDFIYDHFTEFRLIVCCSGGTEYENYVDTLVEIETLATRRFIDVIKSSGFQPQKMQNNLLHILCNAYFSAVFETVAHEMDKAEASAYVEQITAFFTAGWNQMLGLS